jgi:ABC-2 type transport system permease protein
MTFLQRSLGKNYKWFYIIKYSLLRETGGKIGFLSQYLATIVRNVSTNYVWFLASADSALFSYLLIGSIYRGIVTNVYYYRLSSHIYEGRITSKLMSPINFFAEQYVTAIGARITKNFFQLGGVALAVIICLLTFAKIDFDWRTIPSVIFMIPITFTLYQLIGTIFGSVAFWVKNSYDFDGIKDSFEAIFIVLVGGIIPLYKLPFGIDKFLELLPTAYIIHHPMQIYLGKYDTVQIIICYLGGIAWCLVLFILARIVFKLGLQKNESIGL